MGSGGNGRRENEGGSWRGNGDELDGNDGEPNDNGLIVGIAPGQTCPAAGNPIVLSTGNKIEPEQDFASSGEMALHLVRTYNHYWQGAGLFGKHWISNFDYKLSFGTTALNSCYPRPGGGTCSIGSNTVIYAWRPDGRTIKYIKNATDGVFYEDKPSPISKIVKQGDDSFILYGEDNLIEKYSSAGYVAYVQDEHGLRWTYSYSGTYPTRVTHTSTRYVEFIWTNGQLTSVRDPANNHHGYTYTANLFGTGLHRLATATRPGTPATTVSYHYEIADKSALTGKSFNGQRYSTFGYNSSGYAIRSEHSSLERNLFTYSMDANGVLTSVHTNSLGKQTAYTFQDGKPLSVTGHASTYCPVATYAETTYDANGYPRLKSDNKGNDTLFTYNSKGQLTEKVEAYDTGVARKTTYVWDSAKNRITSVTIGGTTAGSELVRTSTAYTADNRIHTVTTTNLSANGIPDQARTTTYTYTEHPNGMLETVTEDGPSRARTMPWSPRTTPMAIWFQSRTAWTMP